MNYKIKRPELDRAIRALYKNPTCFDSELNRVCEAQFGGNFDVIGLNISCDNSITGTRLVIPIFQSDIEEQPEYKPGEWNPYPLVKPPKVGVKYLISVKEEYQMPYIAIDEYHNGCWDNYCDDDVTAFYELPEPYKSGKEE